MSCLKNPSPGLQTLQRSLRTLPVLEQWSTCQRPAPPGVLVPQMAQQLPCTTTIASYSGIVKPYFFNLLFNSYLSTRSGLAIRHFLVTALTRSGWAFCHSADLLFIFSRLAARYLAEFFLLRLCSLSRLFKYHFLLVARLRTLRSSGQSAYFLSAMVETPSRLLVRADGMLLTSHLPA